MTLISQEWLSNFLSLPFFLSFAIYTRPSSIIHSQLFSSSARSLGPTSLFREFASARKIIEKNQSSRVMAEWNPQSHFFPWGKKLTTVFFSPSFSLLIYCRHFPIQWLRSCPPDNNCCCLNQSVVNHIINPSQLVNTLWLWLLLLFPLPLSVRSISLYARRSTDLT